MVTQKHKLEHLIAEYEEYFMPGGIQQSYSELKQLVEEIGEKKFMDLCEIGIADGATLWLYSHLFANQGARFTVVDMDIRPITRRVIAAIEEEMGIMFKIIESKTMGLKLEEGIFDFLHIDGDHGYEEVRYDYYTHSQRVITGGIIIIHDTLLMDGPNRLRQDIEFSGTINKTFKGTDTLCDCFAPNRGNPQNRAFGTTVVWK